MSQASPWTSVERHPLDYSTAESGNPFVAGYYGTPATAVYDGHFWVYATTAEPDQKNTYMDAFSSSDLINWTKHQKVFSSSVLKWAKGAISCPSSIYHKGKYYLYVYTQVRVSTSDSAATIGLAVVRSDRPEGPYTDGKGSPLLLSSLRSVQNLGLDVVTDDQTGSIYIYHNDNSTTRVSKLGSDMIHITEFDDGKTSKEIGMLEAGSGVKVFKRGDTWYLLSLEPGLEVDDSRITYATADSPLGPFRKQGSVLEPDHTVCAAIGLGSVVRVPKTDIWYAVYPRRQLHETDSRLQVLAYDRLFFADDARINPVSLLVKDNFANDGMLSWTTYGGDWTVKDGHLLTEELSNGMALLDVDFTDFTLDATIASTKGTGHPGLLFRVTDLSVETKRYKGYKAALSPAGTITLGKADSGVFTDLIQAKTDMGGISEHHMRIVANGSRLQIFVDDMEKSKVDFIDNSFSHGTIGVRVYNSAAKFGSISVTKLSSDSTSIERAASSIDDTVSLVSTNDSLQKPEPSSYTFPSGDEAGPSKSSTLSSLLCCARRR